MKSIHISDVIDARPLGSFQKRIIALCAATAFVEGFDAQNAGFVAPAIGKAFALHPSAMGLFFSLGLFGLMLGALFVGPIADRLGRKPVLLICLTAFGLGSLAMAASPTANLLFIFRFVTGLGIGGAMPNAIALTSEFSPRRIRSLMVVTVFNGFTSGAIVAGLAASWVVQAFGWQWVFVIGGVCPLLLVPVLAFALPESIRFLASRTASEAKAIPLLRRIAPEVDLPSDAHLELDEMSDARMSVAALFRHGRARTTILLWTAYFCSLLDLFLLTSWLPTQMRDRGFPVTVAILLGTLLQVGGLLAIVLGKLMDRYGASRVLFASYVLGAVSVAAIAVSGANLTLVAVSVFLCGFGVVGSQSSINAVSAAAYPTAIRSTGVGWSLGVGRLGSIVGPSLAGVLIGMGVSGRSIFLMAVVPALCAALAVLALGLNSPASSKAEP
jgi:AAHS family 4-hydroxybenzoate transporter-like MFS transporter